MAKCKDGGHHDWTRYKVDTAYLHDTAIPFPVRPSIPVSVCAKCWLIDLWLYVPEDKGDDDIHLVAQGKLAE